MNVTKSDNYTVTMESVYRINPNLQRVLYQVSGLSIHHYKQSQGLRTEKSNMNSRTTTDDMLQNVSSSIWSFVNDVKNNVLSSLNEVESETRSKPTAMYNLETGSAVDIRRPPKLTANETEGDSDTDLLEPVASDDEDNLETLDLSIYRR